MSAAPIPHFVECAREGCDKFTSQSDLCARHLKKLGVEIKESSNIPPEDGVVHYGLFAMRDFKKDEIIAKYKGPISTSGDDLDWRYVMETRENPPRYINASEDTSCVARYVNSNQNTTLEANCAFREADELTRLPGGKPQYPEAMPEKDRVNLKKRLENPLPHIFVVTEKAIRTGEEFLADHGTPIPFKRTQLQDGGVKLKVIALRKKKVPFEDFNKMLNIKGTVTVLDLGKCVFTKDELQAIITFIETKRSLTTLIMSNHSMTPQRLEILRSLKYNTHLTTLKASSCPLLTQGEGYGSRYQSHAKNDIAGMLYKSMLTTVDLSQCGWETTAAQYLAEAFIDEDRIEKLQAGQKYTLNLSPSEFSEAGKNEIQALINKRRAQQITFEITTGQTTVKLRPAQLPQGSASAAITSPSSSESSSGVSSPDSDWHKEDTEDDDKGVPDGDESYKDEEDDGKGDPNDDDDESYNDEEDSEEGDSDDDSDEEDSDEGDSDDDKPPLQQVLNDSVRSVPRIKRENVLQSLEVQQQSIDKIKTYLTKQDEEDFGTEERKKGGFEDNPLIKKVMSARGGNISREEAEAETFRLYRMDEPCMECGEAQGTRYNKTYDIDTCEVCVNKTGLGYSARNPTSLKKRNTFEDLNNDKANEFLSNFRKEMLDSKLNGFNRAREEPKVTEYLTAKSATKHLPAFTAYMDQHIDLDLYIRKAKYTLRLISKYEEDVSAYQIRLEEDKAKKDYLQSEVKKLAHDKWLRETKHSQKVAQQNLKEHVQRYEQQLDEVINRISDDIKRQNRHLELLKRPKPAATAADTSIPDQIQATETKLVRLAQLQLHYSAKRDATLSHYAKYFSAEKRIPRRFPMDLVQLIAPESGHGSRPVKQPPSKRRRSQEGVAPENDGSLPVDKPGDKRIKRFSPESSSSREKVALSGNTLFRELGGLKLSLRGPLVRFAKNKSTGKQESPYWINESVEGADNLFTFKIKDVQAVLGRPTPLMSSYNLHAVMNKAYYDAKGQIVDVFSLMNVNKPQLTEASFHVITEPTTVQKFTELLKPIDGKSKNEYVVVIPLSRDPGTAIMEVKEAGVEKYMNSDTSKIYCFRNDLTQKLLPLVPPEPPTKNKKSTQREQPKQLLYVKLLYSAQQ